MEDALPRQPPMDEKELIKYKNRKLADRVDEQRNELRELEQRLQDYEQKQNEYQDTLSCVNRLWSSLNQDILYLINRSLGQTNIAQNASQPSCPVREAADELENGDEDYDASTDPFMEALLKDSEDDPTASKLATRARLHTGHASAAYSTVELALRSRMHSTNSALDRLLQLLQTQRDLAQEGACNGPYPGPSSHSPASPGPAAHGTAIQHNEQVAGRVGGHTPGRSDDDDVDMDDAQADPGSGAPQPPGTSANAAGAAAEAHSPVGTGAPYSNGPVCSQGRSPVEQLKLQHRSAAKLPTLQSQLDAQYAMARAVEGRVKLLQDQVEKNKHMVRQLQTQVADKDAQLFVLKGKLDRYRAAAAARGTAGGPLAAEEDTEVGEVKREGGGGVANGTVKSEGHGKEDDEMVGLVSQAEVAQLKKLLDKRTSEMEAAKETAARLQREVRDTRELLYDENHILESRAYKVARQQMEGLHMELHRLHTTMDKVQRELAAEVQAKNNSALKAQQGEAAREGLKAAEARCQQLEQQCQQLMSGREALLQQQTQQQARYGNASTVEELTVMINTLQKENTVMKGQVVRLKASGSRLEEAIRKEAEVAATLQLKDTEMADVRQQLGNAQREATELRQQMQLAAERNGELKLFVEVLLAFGDDPRDLAAVRLQEKLLEQQVEELNKKLQEAAAEKQQLLSQQEVPEPTELEAQQQEKAKLQQECMTLREEVALLKEQMLKSKDEAEAYMGEIESIGNAYEDMQTQNTRLLRGLTERDEANNKLTAENISLQQAAQQAALQREKLEARAAAAEAQLKAAQQTVVDVTVKLHAAQTDALAMKEASRQAALRVDMQATAMKDREEQAARLEAQLRGSIEQLQHHKRSLEDEEDKVQKERAKRLRLDDDHKTLQIKFNKLRSLVQSNNAVQEVQEEVVELKKLLRCSVCDERQKDTIITKCYHMFCSKCIKSNLDTRHRKCPGCNVGFGQNDVKSIYWS